MEQDRIYQAIAKRHSGLKQDGFPGLDQVDARARGPLAKVFAREAGVTRWREVEVWPQEEDAGE
jgi:hypothetical protein